MRIRLLGNNRRVLLALLLF
uniref:Uncharacterized protein n=1 Tax=Anguilla anguilla TaxID=7936 RepID=A0A0E9S484_ANGAN